MSRLVRLVLLFGVGAVLREVLRRAFFRAAIKAAIRLALEKARLSDTSDFVLCLEDVTVEWLNKALQRQHGEEKVVVSSMKVAPFGDVMGNASIMFRITDIEFQKNEVWLPSTMILKTPRNNAANRIPFTAVRMNEMEVAFFDVVQPALEKERVTGVHFPKGYSQQYSPAGNFYVLMGDVSLEQKAEFQTEANPLKTLAQAREIVRGIASFHGPFRGPVVDERFESIIRQDDDLLDMTAEAMRHGWKSCVSKMGDRMPKRLVEEGEALIQIAQRINDYLAEPACLVHGDCHLENCYLVPAENNEARFELGLYDFQLLRRGNGAIDLATFLGGSCELDLVLTHEDKILEDYISRLKEFDPDLAPRLSSLKLDFRIALGLVFCWNVAATLAISFDTEAQVDYFVYFTRICSAVDALDVVRTSLSLLGAKEIGIRRLRGPKPSWDCPPIKFIRANDDLPHLNITDNLFRPEFKRLEPGLWNRIKHELKYRLMLKKTSSGRGHHGQKTTGLSPSFLEGHHDPSWAVGTPVETAAFDSYYLSSFSDFRNSNSPSLALRWCKRARDNAGETWLIVKIPHDAIYTWHDHPNTKCGVKYLDSDTVVVESNDGKSRMSYHCVEPMNCWTAEFEGVLRNCKTGDLVQCSFSLKWTKDMDMFSFGTDVSPELLAKALALETITKEWADELKASHQEHYELFGTTNGKLKIDSTEFVVHGQGMRDHSWGMRDWGLMQAYAAKYFTIGEENQFFNIAMASLPALSNAKFGFVCNANRTKAVPAKAISLGLDDFVVGRPPKEMVLSMVANDDILYTIRMTVEPGDTVPLNMGPDRQLVNFRFASFEVHWMDAAGNFHREVGFGGSEVSNRFNSYTPAKPKLADLKYLPVTGEEL